LPKEQHKQQLQLGCLPEEILRPKNGVDLQYKSVDYPKRSIINSFNSITSARGNKLWQSTKKAQGKIGRDLSISFKDKSEEKKDRMKPVHILKTQRQSILQGHQKKVDFSHLFKKTEKEEVHSFDQEFGLIDH
jgi:hypothetical protein